MSLPTYSDEHLSYLDTGALWQLLVRSDDRVPRNVIDECARRGEEIAAHAAALLERDYYWSGDQTNGEWWLRLHAVMILGLVPGERSGALLVAYMRRIDENMDQDFAEWLSQHWPAFFRSKPESVLSQVRAFAEDRARGWYMRLCAIDVVIASGRSGGEEPLTQALVWAAGMAFDDSEDPDVRHLTGSKLLDFARPEYRSRLEALADQQPDDWPAFDRDDIEQAYRFPEDSDGAERLDDPWMFYAPQVIEKRQRRWAEEEASLEALEDADFAPPGETYVRPEPKIGRNDPCPCGSGKKYKKCCMPRT